MARGRGVGKNVHKNLAAKGPKTITLAVLHNRLERSARPGEVRGWRRTRKAGSSVRVGPQWARKAAYAGLLAGLQGMGQSFQFFDPATRGEVSLLLYNLLHLPGN